MAKKYKRKNPVYISGNYNVKSFTLHGWLTEEQNQIHFEHKIRMKGKLND